VQQRVRVVQLTDRATRYDGMLEGHDHFICEHCGTMTDLVRQRGGRPTCPELGRAGYAVRTHALTFYGMCPECLATTNGKRSAAPAH
jgi:Fe2+ or Zn2+ uptake regulation protein